MSLAVHPFILIAAGGVLAALIVIFLAWKVRGRAATVLLSLLALILMAPAGYVFLLFHPEWIDGRFSTYKQFYSDIQVGMSREQVLSAMEQRYPAGGPRLRPKITEDTPARLGFFMNPETSREPNCEGIFLALEAGKVTRISYSAD